MGVVGDPCLSTHQSPGGKILKVQVTELEELMGAYLLSAYFLHVKKLRPTVWQRTLQGQGRGRSKTQVSWLHTPAFSLQPAASLVLGFRSY